MRIDQIKAMTKEERYVWMNKVINRMLATQIKALREGSGWTQHELAIKTGIPQPRISRMEDPNYNFVHIGPLKKIAEVFDVALVIRFASWGEFTITANEGSFTPLSWDQEQAIP